LLNQKIVAEEVEKAVADHKSSTMSRFSEWSLGFLTDYILANHHVYTKRILPVIEKHLEKVEKVHGQKHPELHEVAELFRFIHQALTQHMWTEENVLFPYIKRVADREDNAPPPSAPFATVRSPVRAMMAEHEREGNNLFKLQALTNNYAPPEDACNTYKTVYAELKAFHEDLIQHISLENNILFPGAVSLETGASIG
jgi:regulator of cell morphogenesis and NO signaling